MTEQNLEDVEKNIQDIEDEEEELIPEEADTELEKEMELTGNEEEYWAKLRQAIREWKASVSEHYNVRDYVRGIKEDDKFSHEDLELFHAFLQVTKRDSYFFRTKFERKLRHQLEGSDRDTKSTSYRLAKILESLNPTEAQASLAA